MVGTALGNVMGASGIPNFKPRTGCHDHALYSASPGLHFQFRSVSGLFDIYLSDFCRADWRSLIKILQVGGRSLHWNCLLMATNFDVLIARNFLDSHASGYISREAASSKPHLRECLSWRACLSRRSLGTPEDRRAHLPKLFLATVLVIVVLIGHRSSTRHAIICPLIFGADFRELSLL